MCFQEGAEHPVPGQLLEPVAAPGEEGEPRPRHAVRPLPQQHHTPLRAGQRGLGPPLQEGTKLFALFPPQDGNVYRLQKQRKKNVLFSEKAQQLRPEVYKVTEYFYNH